MVIDAGVWRCKRFEWGRGELYDVRSGETAESHKARVVFELQVWKRNGEKVSLFRGRSDEELRWMATVLRRSLYLPPERAELNDVNEHSTIS